MIEKHFVRVNDVFTGAITGGCFKVLKVYSSCNSNKDVNLMDCESGKIINTTVNYIQYMVHSGGFII